jgi:hypothetical protein
VILLPLAGQVKDHGVEVAGEDFHLFQLFHRECVLEFQLQLFQSEYEQPCSE